MASFLAPNIKGEFAPYVSKVNPELYANIIMTKQSQQEAGEAQLQSYVDSVTGIQVGRSVDKEYLSSKISEMASEIDSLVGNGDLTSRHKVRRAGAYANAVWNDPLVKNAAISYKNQVDMLSQIEKAKADGTYNVSNADVLLSEIDTWHKGGQDAFLNKGSYIEYYDVASEYAKYIKDKRGNIIEDYNMVTGSDGQPMKYVIENGKRVVYSQADAENDFRTFLQLNGKANTQVSLDARYASKSMPDADALVYMKNSYDNKRLMLKTANDELNTQIKLNGANPDIVAAYQDRIRKNEDRLLRLAEEEEGDMSLFKQDPNSIKSRIYKEQLVTGVGARFAFTEVSRKLDDMPGQTAALGWANFGLATDKFKYQQESDRLQRSLDWYNAETSRISALNKGGSSSSSDGEGGVNSNGNSYYSNEGYLSEGDYGHVTEATVSKELGDMKSTSDQGVYEMLYRVYGDEVKGMITTKGDGVYYLAKGVDSRKVDELYNKVKDAYENNQLDGVEYNAANSYFSNWDPSGRGIGSRITYQTKLDHYSNAKKTALGDEGVKNYYKKMGSVDGSEITFRQALLNRATSPSDKAAIMRLTSPAMDQPAMSVRDVYGSGGGDFRTSVLGGDVKLFYMSKGLFASTESLYKGAVEKVNESLANNQYNTSPPRYRIMGSDKGLYDRAQSVIQGYVSTAASAEASAMVNHISSKVKDGGGDGVNKASIDVWTKGGKYYLKPTSYNGDPLEISHVDAKALNPKLLEGNSPYSVVVANQQAMMGRGEVPAFERSGVNRNTNPDYSFKFKFTSTNPSVSGQQTLQVMYKHKDSDRYVEIPEFSRQDMALPAAWNVTEQLLRMDKQTFESYLKK